MRIWHQARDPVTAKVSEGDNAPGTSRSRSLSKPGMVISLPGGEPLLREPVEKTLEEAEEHFFIVPC
jgi:hypothetical protein